MYLTGMGTRIATFFQTTTMMISIPSVIILTALFISLWGASIRFTTPMLFALGFLPMFGIGGSDRVAAGFQRQRHSSARHLLRHRPFPLHRRAGDDFRAVCRNLLLVSEGDRAVHERVLGQGAFCPLLHVHEPAFSCRCSSRAWPACRAACMTAALTYAEPTDAVGRPEPVTCIGLEHRPFPTRVWALGAGADSVHHQFLLEHQPRQEDRPRTIRGTRRRWNGRRQPRRRTAISTSRWKSSAALTNTACPATPPISLRKTNRRQQHTNDSWKSRTQLNPGRTPAFTTPKSASGSFWRRK